MKSEEPGTANPAKNAIVGENQDLDVEIHDENNEFSGNHEEIEDSVGEKWRFDEGFRGFVVEDRGKNILPEGSVEKIRASRKKSVVSLKKILASTKEIPGPTKKSEAPLKKLEAPL